MRRDPDRSARDRAAVGPAPSAFDGGPPLSAVVPAVVWPGSIGPPNDGPDVPRRTMAAALRGRRRGSARAVGDPLGSDRAAGGAARRPGPAGPRGGAAGPDRGRPRRLPLRPSEGRTSGPQTGPSFSIGPIFVVSALFVVIFRTVFCPIPLVRPSDGPVRTDLASPALFGAASPQLSAWIRPALPDYRRASSRLRPSFDPFPEACVWADSRGARFRPISIALRGRFLPHSAVRPTSAPGTSVFVPEGRGPIRKQAQFSRFRPDSPASSLIRPVRNSIFLKFCVLCC